MDERRLERSLARITQHWSRGSTTVGEALSAAGVELLGVDGVGITLHSRDAVPISFGASGPVMARIEELERTLGEGPCIDAFTLGQPVAEPDLAATERWPAFSPAALAASARAAFGYPLMMSGGRFGALNLYATKPMALSEEQHHDALALADIATHAVLSALSVTSPEALELELLDIGMHQLVVHQATGMVAEQLQAPVGDALARLRARAFADGRPLSEVAADVVARRLRFAI
jgi:GAF domain-containing protein